MKRLAALVLCTFALSTACSSSRSEAAATVNGTTITTHDLVQELNGISANTDYITSLQGSGPAAGGITVLGSTPGSFDAAFVSQVLQRQLDYALIHEEVGKRHLRVDDACRLEAKNDVVLNLGQQNAASGQQLFDKFPAQYRDVLVNRDADVLSLEANLTGQQCGKGVDAEGYYNSHQDQFTKLCVSLIAVTDPTQVDTILAQARGGADFAALVQQFSVDPVSKANGGAIGCRLPSEFNTTVAGLLQAAKTGDVLDPIPGQGGASIVKLTDRQVAPLDEVRQQAEELATSAGGQALGTWIRQVRAAATVTVTARYGTFDPATFQINPPVPEVSTTTAPASASSSSATP